jgi:hypothetical protein
MAGNPPLLLARSGKGSTGFPAKSREQQKIESGPGTVVFQPDVTPLLRCNWCKPCTIDVASAVRFQLIALCRGGNNATQGQQMDDETFNMSMRKFLKLAAGD